MTDRNVPTLTTDQAARRLKRSATWVLQLIANGRIKGEKRDNRWFVDAASLDEYIACGRQRRGIKPPPEAHALDAPLERCTYQYDGVFQLVCAVLECAVDEALDGDLPAQLWIDSPHSNYWFEMANIDSDAARAAIKSRRRPSCRDAEKLDRVIALHDRGTTWRTACFKVFDYYSETLRYRVARYAEAREAAGMTD